MMEECFDETAKSVEVFQDIEHIEVKDELVDPEEGMFNMQEEADKRESRRINYTFSDINEDLMTNIKKEPTRNLEQNKQINKETANQKLPPVESSRMPPVATTAAKPSQKRHQQISSRSFLKARRPRLGYCGRYDAFGLYVAKKLENLPDRMAIFAQKMISDVLFEAEMGSLNRSSKVVAAQLPPRVREFFEKL